MKDVIIAAIKRSEVLSRKLGKNAYVALSLFGEAFVVTEDGWWPWEDVKLLVKSC